MGTGALEIIEQRLTIKEAAATAKVGVRTIRRWMDDGRLEHIRTETGRVRIEVDALKEVLRLRVG